MRPWSSARGYTTRNSSFMGRPRTLKHTECAPQHLKMRVETVRISPVSVRISGSGADPNMAARQLPPPPEEAMNEPFYHYLRTPSLYFKMAPASRFMVIS